MAFLKKKNACDNCGKDLEEIENPVKDDNHEFCSTDCKAEYAESHEHDDDDEANVCEFC